MEQKCYHSSDKNTFQIKIADFPVQDIFSTLLSTNSLPYPLSRFETTTKMNRTALILESFKEKTNNQIAELIYKKHCCIYLGRFQSFSFLILAR